MSLVSPEIKTSLEFIQCTIIDTHDPTHPYTNLKVLRGNGEFPFLLQSNYTTIFPNLTTIQSIIMNKTHVTFQEKRSIQSQEKHEYYEKIRKKEALQFLKANGMNSEANIALINAVKFTPDAIEIG
jgi:hypothetical protein